LGLIFLGLVVSETVFFGFFISGNALGGGMAATSSMGAVLTSFLGIATGLAGGFEVAAGAAERGPGNETRLTLMDPGANLGFEADAGQKTTEPMKIKWIASEIPKYSFMGWDPSPAPIGYAWAYVFCFICF